jgi:glycosyltransferase involved in cell wall biosynthesis
MKVLIVHNRYRVRTGEDRSVDEEAAILRSAVDVASYMRDSREVRGRAEELAVAWRLRWARRTYRELGAVLRRERPDVAHVHNTFPLITPSALDACRDAGVPVVFTVRNYRIWCASGNFFRNGGICEECVAAGPWRSVRHGCYKGVAASAAVASSQAYHGRRATWRKKVDLWIALTEAQRRKLVRLGVEEARSAVKPNFLMDPGTIRARPGSRALFVGRLEPEKGIATALDAFDGSGYGLDVVGEGSLREAVVARVGAVRYLGALPHEKVVAEMARSAVVVVPSLWEEPFGRVVIESMAVGVPVVASRRGGLTELVRDGETGFLFEPGDAEDLRVKAKLLLEDPERNERMGRRAREEYERWYTPERNLRLLLELYRRAIAGR